MTTCEVDLQSTDRSHRPSGGGAFTSFAPLKQHLRVQCLSQAGLVETDESSLAIHRQEKGKLKKSSPIGTAEY